MAAGIAGKHQLQNATIAVELARRFLQECHALEDTSELPLSFIAGLKAARWPGRCQTVVDPIHGNLTWYLDGAHTAESLNCCMDWFLDLGVGVDFEGNSYVLPGFRVIPRILSPLFLAHRQRGPLSLIARADVQVKPSSK